MKRICMGLSFIAALLLATSCTDDMPNEEQQYEEAAHTLTLRVGMPQGESDSRVAYDDNNLNLVWEEGDNYK